MTNEERREILSVLNQVRDTFDVSILARSRMTQGQQAALQALDRLRKKLMNALNDAAAQKIVETDTAAQLAWRGEDAKHVNAGSREIADEVGDLGG